MIDWRLYLVADPEATLGRPLTEVVAAALRGGVTVVQLRAKRLNSRDMVAQARALLALTRPVGVPLLINDRVDVMLAAGADGVHLGAEDLDPADMGVLAQVFDAHLPLGQRPMIGFSVGTAEEAALPAVQVADYYGVGPVYGTLNKIDAGQAIGTTGLARLIRLVPPKPVVGIGGIRADNAVAVMQAGASGVAVIGAICTAPDPEVAARQLRSAILSAEC